MIDIMHNPKPLAKGFVLGNGVLVELFADEAKLTHIRESGETIVTVRLAKWQFKELQKEWLQGVSSAYDLRPIVRCLNWIHATSAQ